MRFLADESCDFAVVRAPRAAGHDVSAKDFGQLVYAGGKGGAGVVLLRFPAPARRQAPPAVLDLVARFRERLPTSFVVLEPGRARIGSIPT